MEEFCKDGLTFENFETVIYFHPDFKQRPRGRNFLPVSFLNVPAEAEEDKMICFVEQYFTIIDKRPHHPKEEYNGVYYYTSTTV